jgi:hypothetical protein
VGFVGLGVGAVTLGTGGVLAILASNDRSTLAARCPNDVCSEADRSAYDRGKTKANVATIVLAAGAVVTAASVGLVVFGAPKKEEPRMELRAAANGLLLRGTFQ